METKRIVRIVLVSPSDVPDERRIVRDVMQTAQRVGDTRGIAFELKQWEDVGPGFDPRGPQTLIESNLAIERCDLLIGVFWKRFGVVDSPPYSRTALEITAALKARRERGDRPEIAVYFCQRLAAPSSSEEATQQSQVLNFKSELGKNVVYREYTTLDEFAVAIFADLMLCMTPDSGPTVLLSCTPSFVRSGGYTEPLPDLRIRVVGPMPRLVAEVDVRLTFFASMVTNKIRERAIADATLTLVGKDGTSTACTAKFPDRNTVLFEGVPVSVTPSGTVPILTVRGIRVDARFGPPSFIIAWAEVLLGDRWIGALEPGFLAAIHPAGHFAAQRAIGKSFRLTEGASGLGGGQTAVVHLFAIRFRETFPGTLKNREAESSGTAHAAHGTVVMLKLRAWEGFSLFATLHDLYEEPPGGAPPGPAQRARLTPIDSIGRPTSAKPAPIGAIWNGETPMAQICRDDVGDCSAGWEIIAPSSSATDLVLGIAVVGPPTDRDYLKKAVRLLGHLAPCSLAPLESIPCFEGVPEIIELPFE